MRKGSRKIVVESAINFFYFLKTIQHIKSLLRLTIFSEVYVLTLHFIFQGWIDNMNGPSGLYIAVSILIIFEPPLNEVERGVYWNEIVRL